MQFTIDTEDTNEISSDEMRRNFGILAFVFLHKYLS